MTTAAMIPTTRLTLRRTSRPARVLAGLLSLTVTLLAGIPAFPQAVAAEQQRIRYFHPDHLGSTHLVTDENGQVIERVQYKPFGEIHQREIRNPVTGQLIVADEASRISPFGYTGQRHDTSTGLYFYGGRYYDPQLGRFIQPDPFVQAPVDPQSLNRYSYVRNNPVNLIDPSGFGWLRRVLAVVGAIIATVLLPEGAGFWWSLALGTAGSFAGDAIGAHLEGSDSGRDRGLAGPPNLPSQSSFFRPGSRPVGLFATFNAGGLRAYPTSAPTEAETDDVISTVLNISLLFIAGTSVGRAAVGAVSSVRQATTRAAVKDVVEVFRVEGTSNARILIDGAGNVSIPDTAKTLFLNFGQPGRAAAFLQRRIQQGLSGATLKSFQVPRSFLDRLRQTAIRESKAKSFPNNPLLVDVTKATDQFGLRSPHIKELLKNIIEGSGKIAE